MKFAKVILISWSITIGCIAPVKAEPIASPSAGFFGADQLVSDQSANDQSVSDQRVSQSVDQLTRQTIHLANRQSGNSQIGEFAIQFPGEPETRTRTLAIAGRSYDWTILRLKTEAGFYAVAYTDLSPITIELGANAIVNSIENTLTDEFNWSALNGRGKSIAVNGYPSRELIGTQNNQLSVLRLVLADQRLYVVMSTSEDLTEIGQFIDSFAVRPWQPYVSSQGGFRVDLPLEPTSEMEAIELGGTEFEWNVIEGRNFMAPGDSYSVGYTDVSSEDLQSGADALLNRIGANLIERWQAKNLVESGREIGLDGNPGRSFVGTTAEGQIVAVRFYLVGQRIYGVGALSNNIVNISRFLDSFAVE
ncbi:MAG: hypothetical protein MUF72_19035 [Elainella sp. Prado103]|jgi:hypothetical protein|nr:hypothetical protein [Elainella sp. Prado103]